MKKKLEKLFDEAFEDLNSYCVSHAVHFKKCRERFKAFIDKHFVEKEHVLNYYTLSEHVDRDYVKKEDVLAPPDDMEIGCICGKCKVPKYTMKFYTKERALEIIGEDKDIEKRLIDLVKSGGCSKTTRRKHKHFMQGYNKRGDDVRKRLNKSKDLL